MKAINNFTFWNQSPVGGDHEFLVTVFTGIVARRVITMVTIRNVKQGQSYAGVAIKDPMDNWSYEGMNTAFRRALKAGGWDRSHTTTLAHAWLQLRCATGRL